MVEERSWIYLLKDFGNTYPISCLWRCLFRPDRRFVTLIWSLDFLGVIIWKVLHVIVLVLLNIVIPYHTIHSIFTGSHRLRFFSLYTRFRSPVLIWNIDDSGSFNLMYWVVLSSAAIVAVSVLHSAVTFCLSLWEGNALLMMNIKSMTLKICNDGAILQVSKGHLSPTW